MQPGVNANLVQSRLTRLAKEYRQDGYEVIQHPSPEDLPEDLGSCSFDLIARRNDEVIAAVVRTRQTLALKGSHDLCRMSELVERHPNWDLELVITNSLQQPSLTTSVDESLPA